MKFKKLLAVGLTVALSASVICASFVNTSAQAAENPNPNAAKNGIDAIRDSLNLVWEDDFGGEIGCGAKREALATTNGFDENGNPTSDEVRSKAKWAHERSSTGRFSPRNGQIQLYVGEDGRNSWTEDGVLHIRGQREEGEGYYDPIEKKYYRWTADGFTSAYFKDGETYRQAFRFGMMEAKIYTVNGVALVDEQGNPVYDKDGNIQEDPASAQGLWNGFWTCGNADMTERTSAVSFHDSTTCWPYNGEIDICEAYTNTTPFSTYDYSAEDTLKDENGVIFNFNNGQYYIKYDENGKTLITEKSGSVMVSYDSESQAYTLAEGAGDFVLLTDDDGSQYIQLQKKYDIKQEKNSDGVMSNYVLDKNKKTIVDTDGNCYGTATTATAQFHHHTGTRVNKDGSHGDVAGATSNVKTCNMYAGYAASDGGAGSPQIGDSGYHVYGVYWTPTQFVYYVDNAITGVFDISSPEYRALRECPQYAMLTFPISGAVPGSPNPALQYADYLVDYVRIYQADDSEYGDTGDLDYRGPKGFPTLNEFDKGYDTVNNCVDMSYYQPCIDAYSHINVIPVANTGDVEFSGNDCYRQEWSGAPFRSGQWCVSVRNSAKFTTKNPLSEGKYDIYLQGLSRSYGKDYAVTLNGSDIGSQLKMYSDHPKDQFGRSYGGMADAYLGTAEIVNGSHNITLNMNQSYRPNDNPNTVINGGMVRAIIAVGNSKNTTTVTIDDDSYVTPTATTVSKTTIPQQTTTVSSEVTPIYDNTYFLYGTNALNSDAGQWENNDKGTVFADRNSHGFAVSSSRDFQLFGRSRMQYDAGKTIPSFYYSAYTDEQQYLESGKYNLIALQYVNGSVGTYDFSVYEIGKSATAVSGDAIVNSTIDFTNTAPTATYSGGKINAYVIGEIELKDGANNKIAISVKKSESATDLKLVAFAAVPVTEGESTTTVPTEITSTEAPTTTSNITEPTATEPTTAGPTAPSTSETATTTTVAPIITSATESTTVVPTTTTTAATTTTTTATTTVTTTVAPTTATEITTVTTTTATEPITSTTEVATTTMAVPTTTETPINFGDANSDGKVTAADVLLIRKSIAGQNVTLNSDASDVNCDGKLTAADVLMIRKYIAGQPIVLGK